MILNLFEYRQAQGTVIVIDVLRAFTTSSVLLNRGVKRIYLVKDEYMALHTKWKHPNKTIIFGEKGGRHIKGFDYENSPSEMEKVNIDINKNFIQRTSSGTKGSLLVLNNIKVKEVIAGSFTTARSIKNYIKNKKNVDYLITGSRTPDGGVEDIALAKFLMDQIDLNTAYKMVTESYHAKNYIKNYKDIEIALTKKYTFIQRIHETNSANVALLKKGD